MNIGLGIELIIINITDMTANQKLEIENVLEKETDAINIRRIKIWHK